MDAIYPEAPVGDLEVSMVRGPDMRAGILAPCARKRLGDDFQGWSSA